NFLELKEREERIEVNDLIKENKISLKIIVKRKDCEMCIEAKKGDLVIIKGNVGSGKSSLLLSIIGEKQFYNKSECKFQVNGTISYSSQEAHHLPGSIKENIIFANIFDEIRYRKVLQCCALDSDIRTLSDGDMTFKYLPVVERLKQLEAEARSPLLSSLSASFQTLPTIRCLKAEDYLRSKFISLHDNYTSVYFLYLSTARGFSFIIDAIVLLFITLVVIIATTTKKMCVSDSAEFGLIICMSISLCGLCEWGVRQSTEVDTQLVSFERIYECLRLPSEKLNESECTRCPFVMMSDWPKTPSIEFKNVCMQYASNDRFAINHLSFKINANEKIGIVGRTGSGKSSIVNALFRLYSSAGSIKIDGVDINMIDLCTLRSNLSIIPQQPVFFNQTLRFNLDPFQVHTDDELMHILREIKLDDKIANIGGLNAIVSECGNSIFSEGEKQLLSLARVLLNNNKILILDEATANIDFRLVYVIKNTLLHVHKLGDKKIFLKCTLLLLSKHFEIVFYFLNCILRNNGQLIAEISDNECTVITIAHRLQTIMDSERVLVLDNGILREFDDPYTLLADENSLFSSLVRNMNNVDIYSFVSKSNFEK
ncbi:putative multidrug resistance-associated protein lethal(2)03659-like protein, partial [Leptotrombidium deliense]